MSHKKTTELIQNKQFHIDVSHQKTTELIQNKQFHIDVSHKKTTELIQNKQFHIDVSHKKTTELIQNKQFHIDVSHKKTTELIQNKQFHIDVSHKKTTELIQNKQFHIDVSHKKTTELIQNKQFHIDGLVQERHNSIANAMELCLSCTNPLICQAWMWRTNPLICQAKMWLKISQCCGYWWPDTNSCKGHLQAWQWAQMQKVNSSPPGQNGRHFADSIFRCIFMNEKFCTFIKISVKFVPKGAIDNNPVMMAWRRIGDKPLSEPMLTLFTAYMHICITMGRWVKHLHENAQMGWTFSIVSVGHLAPGLAPGLARLGVRISA